MAILFITHDLGVVAEIADRVAVMYAGHIVETGGVHEIFARPLHPYTRALLASVPSPEDDGSARLETIEGSVPLPHELPPGCLFGPRCAMRIEELCNAGMPASKQVRDTHQVRCFRAEEEV
jgi:oligopeptide/dipeptide ABC transporter ATP-binding protein